jgi:hypothetical protein
MHKKPNNKHAKIAIIETSNNFGHLIILACVRITNLGKIWDTDCENRCQALAVVFLIVSRDTTERLPGRSVDRTEA